MQQDIGFPFTISSITYVRPSGGYGWAGEFSMKMAHVTIDELSQTFSDNCDPDALQEVVFIDSLPLYGLPESSLTIEFDQPFHYNGTDNLLIDIYYPHGMVEAAVYNWEAGPARSVVCMFSPYGSAGPTGELTTRVPCMILGGELELAGITFGGIKLMLGGTN